MIGSKQHECSAEVEKVVDSASLTHRNYFQELGLTENILENIME